MKKMAKYALQMFTGICATVTLCAGKAMALSVREGAEAARADDMPADLIGSDGVFTQLTNVALYVIGAISVIMLIWGGLRYVISGGDNKKVTDAKNTILYAIIGLIVSVLAFAIVNFVLNAINRVTTNEPTTSETREETGEES